jgi:hypothetical protein
MIKHIRMRDKVLNIRPGDTFIYHTGLLGLDRGVEGSDISDLANTALAKSDIGAAYLTQRKVGPWEFEYIITGASLPRGE